MLPALRILFLLGFRTIYLMGADFTMSEDYTYHFDEQRAKGSVKCNTNTYKKMQEEYFPQLQKEFKAEGLDVFNCNPDSGLKCFDHVPYLDAIAEATGALGDVVNERTWGMYCKPGDKDKWKDEAPEESKPYLKNFENRDNLVTATRSPNSVSQVSSTANREPVKDASTNTTQTKMVNVVEIEETPQPPPVDRTVTAQTAVERVEEVPSTPMPPNATQVPGERKLIKHLPFRG